MENREDELRLKLLALMLAMAVIFGMSAFAGSSTASAHSVNHCASDHFGDWVSGNAKDGKIGHGINRSPGRDFRGFSHCLEIHPDPDHGNPDHGN